MSRLMGIFVGSVIVASALAQGSAMAATAAAAPAASTPATGVVCQIAPSGKYVHVQAVNKGTADVPAGDTFAFVIQGPTKKSSETYKFKTALAAGKSVDISKAIKAASVKGCTPTA